MPWVNDDGLVVRYATEEAANGVGGEYGDFDPGSVHLIEIEVSPDTMGGATGTVNLDHLRLPGGNDAGNPWGIHVVACEVSTEQTLTGDVSVGVAGPTGSVTTAFVAAATSWPAAGATPVAGGGSWVNTVQTGRLKGDIVTYTVNTPVTAGKGYVRIWYRAVDATAL